MSRASEYAINLFRQTKGPLRCLAASDPCGRRTPPIPEVNLPPKVDAKPALSKPEETAR